VQIYEQIVETITKTGSASAINEFRDAISIYDLNWPSPLSGLNSSWLK
jgi:hypothetical protein